MDRNIQTWFMVLVVATTVSVVIQISLGVVVLWGLNRLRAKSKEIEAIGCSHGITASEIAIVLRETLGSLQRVANNAADLSERIKSTVDEAAEVSERLLIHADQVIDATATRVERISDTIERGIVQPVREIQPVLAGLRAMLGVYFRGSYGSEEIRTCQERPLKRRFP
jgi:hypothetical protein